MATTSVITAGTTANSGVVACTGPTLIVISGTLNDGETITIVGEDAAGNYTDELYRFIPNGNKSILIETYRSVTITKTATAESVGVSYGN